MQPGNLRAKRLYVRLMRLETVTFMRSAIALYGSLGFKQCDAYYEIIRQPD